jgi:ribosomal protein L11 methyltransferase
VALYPALDIRGVDLDLALAAATDASPLAAETSDDVLVVYFSSADQRNEAEAAVLDMLPDARTERREVDDGDWARRSQADLGPITVGRVTVTPTEASRLSDAHVLAVVIRPSMGFGTGHHATTRLCLAALQTLDLSSRDVLDVGTGSGVLALAARALGASDVLGVDVDPDALLSARENLPLNPHLDRVRFEQRDLGRDPLPSAQVVTANLTGALLCRAAASLIGAVAWNGHLIVSGLLSAERDDVCTAFAELDRVWDAHEDEWTAICFHRPLGNSA